MRHSARLGASALVLSFASVLTVGIVVSAGPAAAAAVAAPAPVVAQHGLGARVSLTSAPAPAPVPVPVRTAVATSSALVVLPTSIDLKKWAVTPGNQGALNSCVPWTIDYAMLGWYSRYSGRLGQPFAPMYTYSQINAGGDWGSDPTAALQLAVTQGNATRAAYPRGDSNWKTAPTAAERFSAAQFKVKSFTTVFVGVNRPGATTLLKQAIATNHPVAIELSVRYGFDYLAKSPTATDTDTTSAVRGDHEVLAVGYDATGLIVQNSWGTGWANGGFGRISWAVVQKDVGEAETITGFAKNATAPSVSVPVVGRAVTVVKGRTNTHAVSWHDTLGDTGAVTANNAWYQVDSGPFVAVRLASAKATSFTLVTKIGHRYRVAARDAAGGHVGTIRYSATFVG